MTQFMDDGARNWLYKYVKKNHWRVAAWIDYDDLIQEGYFAYYDTLRRYPTAVAPQHIMALFKLVLRSNIEDMVRRNSKQVDDARSDIVEVYDGDSVLSPDLSSLRALMLKAPKLAREAFKLLADVKTQVELTKPLTTYDNGKRETMNERFCRLLGKDPRTTDVIGLLRMHYSLDSLEMAE